MSIPAFLSWFHPLFLEQTLALFFFLLSKRPLVPSKQINRRYMVTLMNNQHLISSYNINTLSRIKKIANVITFSRAYHGLHVSRAWQRLHAFRRFSHDFLYLSQPIDDTFPVLSKSAPGDTFARAFYRLRVFPRLIAATRFPALDTGYMFSTLGTSQCNHKKKNSEISGKSNGQKPMR